jgi:hypothetical protein
MRTAEICPTCATYQNALCIIYNGGLLTNLDIAPLDSIEAILVKINNNFVPTTSALPSAVSAVYLGQQHLDTAKGDLFSAKTIGLGAADWDQVLKTDVTGCPEYANNADAILGGLTLNQVYRTGDLLKIVY